METSTAYRWRLTHQNAASTWIGVIYSLKEISRIIHENVPSILKCQTQHTNTYLYFSIIKQICKKQYIEMTSANTSTAPTSYSAFDVILDNRTLGSDEVLDEVDSEEVSITKTYGELYFDMVKVCCPIMANEFFQVLLSLGETLAHHIHSSSIKYNC